MLALNEMCEVKQRASPYFRGGLVSETQPVKQNSGQIFSFWEIPMDFCIVFLSKISGDCFRNLHQKIRPENFKFFQRKLAGSKFSFFLKNFQN